MSHKCLATWSGDLFATRLSHENRVFCALRTVFKKLFSFPSNILTVHCLVHSSLSQTHRVSLQNPPFSSSSLLQPSRKGMGCHLFSKYFLSIAFNSLIFVLLLRFEIYDFRIWVGFIWVEFVIWVLLILIVWCLFHMFSWLILSFEYDTWSVLCCAYHSRMSQWELLVTLRCS